MEKRRLGNSGMVVSDHRMVVVIKAVVGNKLKPTTIGWLGFAMMSVRKKKGAVNIILTKPDICCPCLLSDAMQPIIVIIPDINA